MRFTASALILLVSGASAFTPAVRPAFVSSTALAAEIRPDSEKSKVLRFGWDGSSALGGAVVDSTPARMLDEIRAVGETIPDDCEVFNANVEMDADTLKFEDVMELIDEHYETQLLEFKNGDILNKPGENEGSAKLLSYAALANMDKATTLKLWGQYYREVLADPDGGAHANIRNFMKYGWEGVPFENGIALTCKNTGEGEWNQFSESWIP
jgi:hypothetical protein